MTGVSSGTAALQRNPDCGTPLRVLNGKRESTQQSTGRVCVSDVYLWFHEQRLMVTS